MDNMIKMLGEMVTPDLLDTFAGATGESKANTQSATSSIISSLVGTLANKGATPTGADALMGMLNQKHGGLDLMDIVGNFAGMAGNADQRNSLMGAGDSILGALLPGNQMGGVLDLITGAAGIKKSSTSSIMRLLAPLALGFLRRRVMNKGLDAGGLAGFLKGQRGYVQESAPRGLGGILGIDGLNDKNRVVETNRTRERETVQRAERKVVENREPQKSGGGFPSWLIPLLLLLGLGFLAWTLLGGNNNDTNTTTDSDTAVCTTLGSLETAINGVPSINADLEVSALESWADNVGGVVDTVAGFGSASALTQAFDGLTDVVGAIPGTTIGDNVEVVDEAVASVRESGERLMSRNNCE